MGKYLLFYGDKFYPSGGWKDYRGAYSSPAEALTAALEAGPEWGQVVDATTGEIVHQWDQYERKESPKKD